MTKKSHTPQDALSRRHFLYSTGIATAAIGLSPLTSLAAPVLNNAARAGSQGRLCLWSDRPAETWMTEAFPIGNGPMGAMLFGGTTTERIQFNEISLWAGDRMAVEGLGDEGQNMGSYQAFGDIFIHLGHDFTKVTHYRQELDIDRAIHQVTYEYNGVQYKRIAFASHPDGVIVIQLTANKPAAYTGHVQLADMHQARIAAVGKRLSSVGKLENGFEYEAQLLVLNENGTLEVKEDAVLAKNSWDIVVPATSLAFDKCDSLTLILGAGTNFLQDHTKQWLGEHPHKDVTGRVNTAAGQTVKTLQARHVEDYQSLFHRFSIDVGTTAPDLLARTTLARLEAYAKNTTPDPNLEALFCQFGRYLLISSSRPGSLPANLQGVWNDSNEPAWACDYHSNINL